MCNLEDRGAGKAKALEALPPKPTGLGAGEKGGAGKAPRAHWLEATLYPLEREYAEKVAEAKGYSWVSIHHDRDTKEGGELKAEHIHFLVHFDNARTVTALARDLNIPANRVVIKDSGQGAMAYLTHSTDKARLDGKYEYPVSDLRGPLKDEATQAIEKAKGNADEGRQVVDILDWIDAQGYISIRDLSRWAAREGRWAVFRRAGVIFKAIIEEHNTEVFNQTAGKQGSVWDALELTDGRDPKAYAKLKARQLLKDIGYTEDRS